MVVGLMVVADMCDGGQDEQLLADRHAGLW